MYQIDIYCVNKILYIYIYCGITGLKFDNLCCIYLILPYFAGFMVSSDSPQEVLVVIAEPGQTASFNITIANGILSYDLSVNVAYKGK